MTRSISGTPIADPGSHVDALFEFVDAALFRVVCGL
jgi:hypothetical protein